MEKLLIKDLPKNERPRERLLTGGVEILANDELIAIILKTGTKSESVKMLSNRVLKEARGIHGLKNITINKLLNIKGIGLVKAIELKAAIELGKRVYYDYNNNNNPIKLDKANLIYEYFKYSLSDKKQEYFYCLYLDAKNNLIDKRLLFIGTLNKSIVHPREIFKEAYLLSASNIICVHNHPSGDVKPSQEDIFFTKNLVNIGIIQGIPVLDHIIISDNGYYSFYENNEI
ncbi:MAG: RadC family protein [Bacilli bacterium]|jgi:DNA repair protein RadC